MKRNRLLMVAVLLMFMLSGCGTKYMKEWNPKQRAIYAEGLYIKQWDAHNNKIAYAAGVDPDLLAEMVISEDPIVKQQVADIGEIAKANLTEAERKVLRTQKKVLVQTEHALDLYEIAIETGKQPSPALEKQIINLSNQLETWLLEQPW